MRNIVITGGSDGLGKTLTEELSKDNNVIILATNTEKLIKVANDNNCNYKVCDVSDYNIVTNVFNEIIDEVVYNATKWGVTGFSKSLQDEVAKYGIRVTDVLPGMMKTDMFNKMNIQRNMENGLDTKEVARLIKFVIDTPNNVMIPEVGIKNINN